MTDFVVKVFFLLGVRLVVGKAWGLRRGVVGGKYFRNANIIYLLFLLQWSVHVESIGPTRGMTICHKLA